MRRGETATALEAELDLVEAAGIISGTAFLSGLDETAATGTQSGTEVLVDVAWDSPAQFQLVIDGDTMDGSIEIFPGATPLAEFPCTFAR